MIYTFEYDNNYIPALPVVEVTIKGTPNDHGLVLKALVDSGADATMIPWQFLRQLQVRKGAQKQIRGIAGFSYLVDTYRLSLRVGGYETRLTAIADRQNQQMILGRDVLNDLIVTLNGLAGVVEIGG